MIPWGRQAWPCPGTQAHPRSAPGRNSAASDSRSLLVTLMYDDIRWEEARAGGSQTSFLPTKSLDELPDAMPMPTNFSMSCFSVARACITICSEHSTSVSSKGLVTRLSLIE